MSFKDDALAVASTAAGRRFMWHLLNLSGLFSTPLGSTDAITNFNCGKQALGQDIVAVLNEVDSAIFVKVLTEPIVNQLEKSNARSEFDTESESR